MGILTDIHADRAQWETYATVTGTVRINIGLKSYLLFNRDGSPATDVNGTRPGDPLESRQLAGVFQGEYGSDAQAWAEAHRAHGVEPHFAWRGIVNELGDHASVGVPWRAAKPRDFGLAE